MIAEEILKLINSETFQGLVSYYDETTFFNVIGAERSENRHSAFLRWFFSTDSSHGLGDKRCHLQQTSAKAFLHWQNGTSI